MDLFNIGREGGNASSIIKVKNVYFLNQVADFGFADHLGTNIYDWLIDWMIDWLIDTFIKLIFFIKFQNCYF